MEPPDNELPGTIAFQAVLGRNDVLALAIVGGEAYSTGISISIAVRLRHSDRSDDGLSHELFGHHRDGGSGGQLLFGIAYPDGRTASNVSSGRFRDPFLQLEQPEQPILVQRGGGGGDRTFGIDYWLTPAPPPGDLTIVVAWPSRGILESHTTIPAELIAAGVAAAVELWPWEPPEDDDAPPAFEPPPLPEGGWFAKNTPDSRDRQ